MTNLNITEDGSKYYEIPATLVGTYRQMTIDTPAALDPAGFSTGDSSEAERIMEMVAAKEIEVNGDDYDYSDAELCDLFQAVYGRQPDASDREGAGLFSLICAGI